MPLSVPVPKNMPDYDTNPDAYIEWAKSPEGVQYFSQLNDWLMSQRAHLHERQQRAESEQPDSPTA